MANQSPRTSAQSHDYQSAHEMGKKRAADWFAQHGHSLAVFRDLERASFLLALGEGFNDGFAEGLAIEIAGGVK